MVWKIGRDIMASLGFWGQREKEVRSVAGSLLYLLLVASLLSTEGLMVIPLFSSVCRTPTICRKGENHAVSFMCVLLCIPCSSSSQDVVAAADSGGQVSLALPPTLHSWSEVCSLESPWGTDLRLTTGFQCAFPLKKWTSDMGLPGLGLPSWGTAQLRDEAVRGCYQVIRSPEPFLAELMPVSHGITIP